MKIKKYLLNIILIIFAITILLITIFPKSCNAATDTFNSGVAQSLNIDWTQSMDNILGQVTTGNNLKIQERFINTVKNSKYKINSTDEDDLTSDWSNPSGSATYKFKINAGIKGMLQKKWLFCVEKGTDLGNGYYIIEKMDIIKNCTKAEIRYAWPAVLYKQNGSVLATDSNIKYFSVGENEQISGDYTGNVYAKWNGNSPIKGSWDGEKNILYYKSFTNKTYNAALAYIITEPNSSSYDTYLDYKTNDSVQNALWQLDNNTTGSDLLKKAKLFASYKAGDNDASALSWKSDSIGVEYKDEYVLIGPLKLQFNIYFAKSPKIKLKYLDNNGETKYLNVECCKANGNKITTISSNDEFYVKVPYSTISENNALVTNIKGITATVSELNVYAFYFYLIQAGSVDIQNQLILMQGKREYLDKSIDLSWEEDLIPPVEIKLNKKSSLKDDSGRNYTLDGAKFTISYGGNDYDLPLLTGSRSQYYYKWNPTNTDDIIVTIKEKTTPEKHQTLSGEIKLKLNLSEGKWNATITNNPDNAVSISTGTRNKCKYFNTYSYKPIHFSNKNRWKD